MYRIYDMIIIGAGPAGCTAALYAARAGLDTLIIEKMSAGGQMALTGDIDNYPGFEQGIDGFTLGMKMLQSAERFDVKTHYAEVLSLELKDTIKKINTTNGEFLCKTVVLSMGANPRELGILGEKDFTGKGVHYCAHCDGRFYKDKTVMVVGGGNSAAADALYLSRLAKKVFVVHRRDTLKATKIYHEPLLKANNVEFIWNSTVKEFVTEGRVVGAVLENTSTGKTSSLSCDGIFISIGRKPTTELLKNSITLDENGYIQADETTKTNLDGVFAVGDIRTKPLRQIVTAVSDGATAVHFAEQYLAEKSQSV